MKTIEVSIVVCTANREELLKKCLDSLLKQTAKAGSFEVLIVDNSVKKSAKEIVKDSQKTNKNFKYIHERKTGLSFARNSGWQEARGKFVAYIDDDSIADRNWIQNIISFIAGHPEVLVFGGPFGRYALIPIPRWYPKDFYVLNLGNKVRPLKAGREWLSGTNMVFKRSILQKYKGFDTALGMSGKKVAYGEETNLQARIIKKEKTNIYYVPSLKMKHLLSTEKLSLRWLLHSRYLLGKSIVKSHGRRDTIFYHIASFAHKFLLMLYYLLLPKPMPVKMRVYHAFVGMFSAVGAFQNYLNNTLNKPKQ